MCHNDVYTRVYLYSIVITIVMNTLSLFWSSLSSLSKFLICADWLFQIPALSSQHINLVSCRPEKHTVQDNNIKSSIHTIQDNTSTVFQAILVMSLTMYSFYHTLLRHCLIHQTRCADNRPEFRRSMRISSLIRPCRVQSSMWRLN